MEEMKKQCSKCGKIIINGVNGCAMWGNECVECHGGFQDYSRNGITHGVSGNGGADYWEGRILARQESE